MQALVFHPSVQQIATWKDTLPFVRNQLCFNTRRDYAAEVRLFAQWSRKNVTEITLLDLMSYREALEAQGLKPATVAKKLTVLRRLFVFLHEQGILPHNPSAGLKVPTVRDESGKDILTLEECHRLLASVDTSTLRGKRDMAIFALLLIYGLRTCEIVRANIGDIRSADGYWVMQVHGKGGKEADTRIRDDVYAVIRSYLDARGEEDAESPLFLGTNHRSSQRLTTRSVQHMVKKYMKKVGIVRPNLTTHSLRHTAVTLVILSGASILKAQEFARHSSPTTTQRYYHNLEAMKDHAVMLSPIHIKA